MELRPGQVITGKILAQAPSSKKLNPPGPWKEIGKQSAKGCGVIVIGMLVAAIAFPLIILMMIGVLKGGVAIVDKALLEPERRHEQLVRKQIANDKHVPQNVTISSAKPTTKPAVVKPSSPQKPLAPKQAKKGQ